MREELEKQSIAVLRSLAKDKRIKGFSTMKKNELVDALVEFFTAAKSQNTEKAQEEKNREPKGPMDQQAPQAEKPRRGRPRKIKPEEAVDNKTTSTQTPPSQVKNNTYQGKPQPGKPAAQNQVKPNASKPQQKDNAAQSQQPLSSSKDAEENSKPEFDPSLIDATPVCGILEVMSEGYGFVRSENYLPGENDVYVAPAQIKKLGLKTGDILRGKKRAKSSGEKFAALMIADTINGYSLSEASQRVPFEKLTPVFPNERIHLETYGCSTAMRMVDLISPVGKGQRGMIVAQPKAGKTTLLKQIAKSITTNHKEMYLIILLIDERPEEVTDIKESIEGDRVEVIYSTFDETAEHHKRVSEMVIERAKRLVEHKRDVCILLDSITRLTRAYNNVITPSGRTLSGGLDPAALYMPKKFFGAARNMREGGSLTILATALVETGSKMDDVVYEEFKGTGNMELVLDRKLSEKRIFPAIDIVKSGTRREDLLLTGEEQETVNIMRKGVNGMKQEEAVEMIIDMFSSVKTNSEFCKKLKTSKITRI